MFVSLNRRFGNEDGLGWFAIFLIIVLILMFIMLLGITMKKCGVGNFTGMVPPGVASVAVAGPTNIATNGTGTFSVTITLKSATTLLPSTYYVRIDENDRWDDTLIRMVPITVPANASTGVATFTLRCPTRVDLAGADGTSKNEAQHDVHAEYVLPLWFNVTSPDIPVQCFGG